MKKINLFVDKFEELSVALLLFSGGFMLFLNVILRYFFSSGIIWAEEFTRFAIIWLTFIGSSIAARKGAHLGVTVIFDLVKNQKIQKALHYTVHALTIFFSIFLVAYGGRLTFEIMNYQTVSSSMQAPMYLIYLAIPVGGLLMTYRFVQELISYHKGVQK